MKILHLTHHFAPCIGGIERVVLDFCKSLQGQGHQCTVLCLNRCPNSWEKLPCRETINGIRVKRLPFLDLRYYKMTAPFLRHLREADVVHVHGLGFFSDFALFTKFIHHKPVVVSSHGAIFHTGSNAFKDFYFFICNRFLLRFADRVIAVSEADRRVFSRIVPMEKIELIENPLDLKKFRAGKKEKNSFLFVGRLSKNKRVDLLIEAFGLAAKERGDFILRIVGRDFDGIGPGLKKLAARIGISKRVEFLGPVGERELARLYSKSDFFVSASEYEGFGISAVEAMASGCIPLLNPIDSFKKFIEEGKNGFLTSFSSPENASRRLEKAMALESRERKKMRERAVQSVQRFSLKNQTEKLIKAYNKILS